MIPHLSLLLFGPMEVRLAGKPIGGFEYNKVRALLAYLAVKADQPQSRTGLCALLWPDLSGSAARQNLSQALTRLRQALGDKQAAPLFLLTTTETVQLKPSALWDLDVTRFSMLLAATEAHHHRDWRLCTPCALRLREAVAHFRGDFLAQLYVSDSAPFEEWTLLQREQLRQRMLSALERLMQYAEWHGAYEQAVAYARRQVELEPLSENAHCEFIRLLALSGQHAAALAQYDYLKRTLRMELDEAPEPETTALYEQIRAGNQREALRRLRPPQSHLPAPPTPLIGRVADVERVCAQLSGSPPPAARALTITGPPGVGKTRLALEAATRLRFDYEDGAHMVELASVADAADVAPAVAQVLGVAEQVGQILATALRAHLQPKHALLVLDNFEHVLDAAPFVADLLAACPDLAVLLTSRAPLHLRAEQQYPLDALALPPKDADMAAATEAEAVQLFVDRARTARRGFHLTPENAAATAAICRRVEGLPLAIELIAPRLKSLSPAEVLQQLESRLFAVAPGLRDAPLRHRTLRNAIRWSYDPLNAREQHIFMRLGVFAGGCTEEAAQTVVGDPGPVLAVLEMLQDVSLLYTKSIANETRFLLLETMREFALEVLTAEGGAPATRQRHAAYFAGIADAADRELLGPDQARWSARVAAELDNLRTALRWALCHDAIETALCIAGGVWRFWWQRGLMREGLSWLEPALAARQEASEVQTRALRGAGVLAMGLNDHAAARRWLEEARNVALRIEAVEAYAAATTNLGMVLREQGDLDAARTYLEESLALAREMESAPNWIKFPLLILARIHTRQGNILQAEPLFEECLRRNRELGDAEGTADALQGIASAAGARGEYERARECCDESLAIYRTLNHQFGMAWAYSALGNLAREQQAYAEALTHYRRCLALWMQREDTVRGALALDDTAHVLSRQGEWARAVCLMSAAEAIRAGAGVTLTSAEQAERSSILAACRAALGESAYTASWAGGRVLSLEQAVTCLGDIAA